MHLDLKRAYVALSPLHRWLWHGSRRICPVCRSRVRRFLSFGKPRRPDELCPVCLSLGRDRFLWTYLRDRQRLDGFQGRVLHLAPEPATEHRLRRLEGADYLTADLDGSRADVAMDITRIELPDGSFDLIFCSHVLEHVPDDRRAIGELHRVLRPGGRAMLIVPIDREETFEDASVTDPAERERLFGQFDHVRRYGEDFADRLRDAGFEVTRLAPPDLLDEEERVRRGVHSYEVLFDCVA